jgi:hypothetical protein
MDKMDYLFYKYKTKIIRYLKSYGERLFSWRSEKLNFRWNATNFVLAVAIVGSIKLVFLIFPIKGMVGLKGIPKFGNTQ